MPDDRRAAPPHAATSGPREPAARTADHAGIDRLAGELLPALIAKLGTTNLGELEVREGAWKIRLRRPAGSGVNYGRRVSDRASRSHPGHEGHGHAPGAVEPHRSGRSGVTVTVTGAGSATLAAVGPGRPGDPAADTTAEPGPVQVFATSPAVGVFQPAGGLTTGTRVRAGDRLGAVDMLGIAQEVSAPIDGILGPVLVDAGTAVEYGQELVHIEPIPVADPA